MYEEFKMIDLGSGLILGAVCYGAAGISDRYHSGLNELDRSDAAAVVSKSATIKAIDHDPIGRIRIDGDRVYNCVGLSNEGLEYYCKWHGGDKPYIVSIYPENEMMLHWQLAILSLYGVQHCEINLSCGNVCRGTAVGADPEMLGKYLDILRGYRQLRKFSVGLKMPPGLWPGMMQSIADVLRGNLSWDYIVCCNSLGGLHVPGMAEERSSASGDDINRGIGLANVRFYARCGFRVVGCGGISTRAHVDEYLAAGAVACQIGAALLIRGAEIFSVLNDSAGVNNGRIQSKL